MSPSPRKSLSLFFIMLLAALGGLLYLLLKDLQHPELLLTPQGEVVSKKTEFLIEAWDTASGVKSLSVTVRQSGQEQKILEKKFPQVQERILEKFTLQEAALTDGPFELLIAAQDGSFANFGNGNRVRLELPRVLDTRPPQVLIQGVIQNINQGGAGAVAYTANKELVRSGVQLRDLFFPGFKQEDGTWVCLFPFPYYMEPDAFRPSLMVVDAAGNEVSVALNLNRLRKKFKSDSLNIPDSFLDSKMPEFEQQVPGQMSNLERFLKVNNDLRIHSDNVLLELAADTSPVPLWRGLFSRMPRAATRATFGDHRAYVYQGQVVDNQVHLGIDLASTRNADVPAANHGRVVFADYLGIYGLVIIVDHGMGLQSLYSHLSQMLVTKGDTVTKNQVIGKTGVSGMAGGDHLHFGMLIGGLAVNPIEWWDPNWLRVSLKELLPQAFAGVGQEQQQQ